MKSPSHLSRPWIKPAAATFAGLAAMVGLYFVCQMLGIPIDRASRYNVVGALAVIGGVGSGLFWLASKLWHRTKPEEVDQP